MTEGAERGERVFERSGRVLECNGIFVSFESYSMAECSG